jgi:hypothetical protein
VERSICGPLEFGLLLLYYGESLRCDLWCLVLRPGLEIAFPEYQSFDRVTSSSIRVTVVNLWAMKEYDGEVAIFIFNILFGLSGQPRAPSTLVTGKYSPGGLAVERWICGTTEAVSRLSRRDKYLASARNRTTIPRTLPGG